MLNAMLDSKWRRAQNGGLIIFDKLLQNDYQIERLTSSINTFIFVYVYYIKILLYIKLQPTDIIKIIYKVL